MGMGRPGEGLSHNRAAALVLAIGVATNPIPLNGPNASGPNRPVIQTTTSAPVAPTRAPTPATENKQAQRLGKRFRAAVSAVGFDQDMTTESKTRGGKFADQNETDPGHSASTFSHRQNHARATHGNNHPARQIRESEHSQTNDLSDLVLQELGSETDLFSINEHRLTAKVQAAIAKVLNPFYVSPEVIAKMDLEDEITNIVAEAAINGSNLLVANPRSRNLAAQQSLKAETLAKIEAAKAGKMVAKKPEAISSKATEGKIGFNPVPESTGGKVLPLTPKEEAVLIDKLLATFVEDTHFIVEKNSQVRLTHKGTDIVSGYLAPMFKDKNLSYSELEIPQFIEANLKIFQAKGREIRLQKFVNAQIAEALKSRDKTQSLNRRQAIKFTAAKFEFDAEQAPSSTTEQPKAEIRHLVTRKSQIAAANEAIDTVLADSYKELGHTGFNIEAEKAKADTYDAAFDNPNGNYSDDFNMKDNNAAYARLRKHSAVPNPALTSFFDDIGDKDTTVVEVDAVTINGGSRSGRRSKYIPQPRGKSPLA